MALPELIVDVLARPLRLVPTLAHSQALAMALNRVMAGAIADGELDFLEGRRVAIEVDDLKIRFRLGLERGRIRGFGESGRADATIAGSLREMLQLAARREDADTLFFQRRLRLAGDTELGLYLKNFLDAFEPPPGFAPLVRALERLAALAPARSDPPLRGPSAGRSPLAGARRRG
jgi:predicted lipid carrier protein YhbT